MILAKGKVDAQKNARAFINVMNGAVHGHQLGWL
jgi:hypothetical protein